MCQLSCENKFCIYQKHGNCALESVKLDIQGNCIDCIYINVEENTLNNMKEETLTNLGDLDL